MLGNSLQHALVVLLCGLLFVGSSEAAKKKPPVKQRAATANISESDIESTDRIYAEFATDFFAAYAKQPEIHKYKSFEKLDAEVNKLLSDAQPLKAIAGIVANFSVVKKNADNPKLIKYLELLVQYNVIRTAENLYTAIKEEGNKSLTANVSYMLADYYFERHNWSKTLLYVEGTSSDLPQERSFHALLMQGVALQYMKQHRAALKLYEKIPTSSKYYLSARTNMAVADIRQDWWTDAHILLNSLVHTPKIAANEEAIDRLYTILGYSFLQQQYYRDSREAFRNVGVNSPYTNQALLGIALNAANQEDFIGALNAVRVLKERNSTDLPGDEAYLLMPYFYERLQQSATAAAGYGEAVQYYERRINDFNGALQYDVGTYKLTTNFPNSKTMTLLNTNIDLSNFVPPALVTNYYHLKTLRSSIGNLNSPDIKTELDSVENRYATSLQKLTNAAIQERITYLTDYMNQSRYGTARLVDKNEPQTN